MKESKAKKLLELINKMEPDEELASSIEDIVKQRKLGAKK